MLEIVEMGVGLMFMWRIEVEDDVVRPSLLVSSEVLLIVSIKFDCFVVAAIPVSEWLLRNPNCSNEEYASLKVFYSNK